MRNSLTLGRIRGIPFGIHWSLGVFAALVAANLARYFFPTFAPGLPTLVYIGAGVVAALFLTASVLAHELGHALVALRGGVRTDGITLWLLGGVARLSSEPRTARHAFEVAIAGPLVSLALAVASGVIAVAAAVIGLPALIIATVGYVAAVNLILAIFNMLPALPLDGGRVLQAWKWHRTGDSAQATVDAANIGRKFGWLIVAIGAIQFASGAGNGLWTILIGIFVLTQAGGERRRAERIIAARSRPRADDPLDLIRQVLLKAAEPRSRNVGNRVADADLIVIDDLS